MENTFVTSVGALRELLQNVNVQTLSDGANQALDGLWDMLAKVDPEISEDDRALKLCDLYSYPNYTLWSGKEDVQNILDCECVRDLLPYISEEDLPGLIDEVVRTVPWLDAVFDNTHAANKVIEATIREVFQTYIDHKPFVVSEGWVDDITDPFWTAELKTSDALIDMLCKEMGFEKTKLISEPAPHFEAFYDCVEGSCRLFGRYYLADEHPNVHRFARIPLSDLEAAQLMKASEIYAEIEHLGKSCLAALNEDRIRIGLKPFKPSLASSIEAAQPAAPAASTPQGPRRTVR